MLEPKTVGSLLALCFSETVARGRPRDAHSVVASEVATTLDVPEQEAKAAIEFAAASGWLTEVAHWEVAYYVTPAGILEAVKREEATLTQNMEQVLGWLRHLVRSQHAEAERRHYSSYYVGPQDTSEGTGLSPEDARNALIALEADGCVQPHQNNALVGSLIYSLTAKGYADGWQAREGSASGQTINVYGSIGALQTGDNSSASVRQSIVEKRSELLEVLEELRRDAERCDLGDDAIDDIDILKEQVVADNPKPTRIRRSIQRLRLVSEGVIDWAIRLEFLLRTMVVQS